MRRIFSKLLYEIEEERNTMLVTVIADRGSAPRGAGAAMLVGEKGRITGTIGGGAVEYQSEKKAMELLKAGESAVHEFVPVSYTHLQKSRLAHPQAVRQEHAGRAGRYGRRRSRALGL